VGGGSEFASQTREKTASKPAAVWITEKSKSLLSGWAKLLWGAVGGAALALRVAVDEAVFLIRAGNVTESPFAVVKKNIRLVNAAAFPRLTGDEDGSGLINPRRAIPFKITNRIGTPYLRG